MEKTTKQKCLDWVMRPDRLFCDLPADAMVRVVQLLSQDLHIAYERVRSIGLCRHRHPRTPRPN